MTHAKFSNELEQRVLENLMDLETHTNSRVQAAMLSLTPDCFYKPDNAIIFGLIRDAFNAQENFNCVDILVKVTPGDSSLHDTMTAIIDNYRQLHASNRSLESDVEKIVALRDLRKQLKLTAKLVKDVEQCVDPIEAQSIMASTMSEIATMNHRESKHGIDNMEITEAFFDGKIVTPEKLKTSCESLNTVFQGGIMPKSLIFVAAGSGVGKTGFSIFLLDAIARQQPGSQTLFFSIEMEYSQIWMRHVGVCAGKPFDQLSEDECMSAVTKLSAVPMRLYDTAICRDVSDLDFILNTARLRAMEKPISVIVVDYLGLVECKQKFERHELQQSFIVKELSKLAQQLNCTVILLSQINRGAATRADGDRCPWPHDAADSSGGHKSSNYWLGVDRPELYRDDPLYSNQFVIKCRKNRFGNLFELILAFNGGTFAEVPFGWFKNPKPLPKNAQEALFSHRGHDFVNN